MAVKFITDCCTGKQYIREVQCTKLKVISDATNLYQHQTRCNVNNDVPEQQKHVVDVNQSKQVSSVRGKLLIEMKMPQ